MRCTNCKKEIVRKIANEKLKRNKRFFCDRKCFIDWSKTNLPKYRVGRKKYPRIELTCLYCGTTFYRKRDVVNSGRGKFCSRSCRGKYYGKEKHSCWKGGISSEYHSIKQSQEYKDWRNEVYKRDKWTCKICGYKGQTIVAHHIKKFSDYPSLRFDVNNGITMCRTCHGKIHNNEIAVEDLLMSLIKSVETNTLDDHKIEDRVRSIQECIELHRNDVTLH